MSKSLATTATILAILAAQSAILQAQAATSAALYYDTDRDEWLVDSDGDATVDLSEKLGGTDPFDPTDYPGSELMAIPEEKVGFPATSCRSSFRLISSRLCISTDEQNAQRYDRAAVFCRDKRARVCTYEDLFYLDYRSTWDASYNPKNMWLGEFVGDDYALCGNRDITFNNDGDMWNFETHCGKTSSLSYWCCHDRE